MSNYDIPNEEEQQPRKVYNYDLVGKQYPISENHTVSTYNQFIQLRDTFIFSKKKYPGKAGKKLIVGDKGDGTDTGTIEVRENNYYRQNFQPNRVGGDIETHVLPTPSGKNVTEVPASLKADYPTFGNLCCMINKDGRYRIVHKEEVLLSTSTEKVYCYVDVYRKDGQGVYKIAYKGGVAVFDREGTSTDYRLGQLIKKMTAFGYQERDLLKGDILVLRMKDATYNSSTGEPTGNNLTIQNDSNYRSIDYLDLPYNF